MSINILHLHPLRPNPFGRLRPPLRRIFRALGLSEDVNFVLVSDRQIRALNRRFLRHDRATDVLAFGRDRHDAGNRKVPLGEVVISLDTARRQAREQGHSLARELRILSIHGLLHLLGYDDHRKKDREKMWRKTDALLKIAEKGR